MSLIARDGKRRASQQQFLKAMEEFKERVLNSQNESDIRDWGSYIENIWDWHILKPAFPGKIRPMDIDSCLERKGHFLFFECKQPGADMPQGQWITYEGMVNEGNKTLIILYGHRNIPVEIRIIYENRHDTGKKPINLEAVIEECRKWFMYADKHPLPVKVNNYPAYGNCLPVSAEVLISPGNGNVFFGSGVQIFDGIQFYERL